MLFLLRYKDTSYFNKNRLFCLMITFHYEVIVRKIAPLSNLIFSPTLFFINNLILNQDCDFLFENISISHYIRILSMITLFTSVFSNKQFYFHFICIRDFSSSLMVKIQFKNIILYLFSNHDPVHLCARRENRIRMEILIEFKMQTDVDCIATKSRIVYFFLLSTSTRFMWFSRFL